MDHKELVSELTIKSIEDLGRFIRDERKRKNLSQAELAARTGVSRRLVYQLENGSRDSFPLGKVLQVLRRLNLEIKVARKRAE